MMEATGFSEKLGFFRTARCFNPEERKTNKKNNNNVKTLQNLGAAQHLQGPDTGN
jgi:hypothetical protein